MPGTVYGPDGTVYIIPGSAQYPLPAPDLIGKFIQLAAPGGGGAGLIHFVWKNGLKSSISTPDPYSRLINVLRLGDLVIIDKTNIISIENDLPLTADTKLYLNLATQDYYLLEVFPSLTVKHKIRRTDEARLIFNFAMAEEGDGTALRGCLSGEEIYVKK